jgi:hypothetical protein
MLFLKIKSGLFIIRLFFPTRKRQSRDMLKARHGGSESIYDW